MRLRMVPHLAFGAPSFATSTLMPAPINEEVVKSFRQSKTLRFHKPQTIISSIDFDDSGLNCITAGNDDSVQLYDAKNGRHTKTVFSKKYGCSLARFTHHSMNCVCASTKPDAAHRIQYLSLHDNQYIRYFRGHTDRVTAIEMSPLEDQFLSASLDNTVRLWDLRSQNAQGILNTAAPCLVGFDPASVVFAVASQPLQSVSLYALKHFDRRPFLTFNVPDCNGQWSKVELANNGKLLLLSTTGDRHFVFDAFNGELVASLVGHGALPANQDYRVQPPSHAAFTVDGQFVFGSAADGKICVWDVSKGKGTIKPLTYLEPKSRAVGPEYITAFNPKTMLFATASDDLTFWLPDREIVS